MRHYQKKTNGKLVKLTAGEQCKRVVTGKLSTMLLLKLKLKELTSTKAEL
jgi:hypothetical protein